MCMAIHQYISGAGPLGGRGSAENGNFYTSISHNATYYSSSDILRKDQYNKKNNQILKCNGYLSVTNHKNAKLLSRASTVLWMARQVPPKIFSKGTVMETIAR